MNALNSGRIENRKEGCSFQGGLIY